MNTGRQSSSDPREETAGVPLSFVENASTRKHSLSLRVRERPDDGHKLSWTFSVIGAVKQIPSLIRGIFSEVLNVVRLTEESSETRPHKRRKVASQRKERHRNNEVSDDEFEGCVNSYPLVFARADADALQK